jgi:hypothetical protein
MRIQFAVSVTTEVEPKIDFIAVPGLLKVYSPI